MQLLNQTFKQFSWLTIASVFTTASQVIIFYFVATYIDASTIGRYAIALALSSFPLVIIEHTFAGFLLDTEIDEGESFTSVLKLAIIFQLLCVALISIFFLLFNDEPLGKLYLALLPFAFMSSVNICFSTLYKRLKDMERVAKIELWGNLVYLIFALSILFSFKSIFALIIALTFKEFVKLFLWIFSAGTSRYIKYKTSVGLIQCWEYGRYILPERLLGAFLNYLDIFLISLLLGKETLGIYEILKRLILRPVLLAYNALEQVYFVLFFESQNDLTSFKRHYIQLNQIIRLFFINVFIFVLINEAFIIKLLPAQYLEYQPWLSPLCIYGVVMLILNPLDILSYSLSLSKDFFKWILLNTIPIIFVSYFSLKMGMVQYLYAVSGFYFVSYLWAYKLVKLDKTLKPSLYFKVLVYPLIVISIIIMLRELALLELTPLLNLLIIVIVTVDGFTFYRDYSKPAA